MDQNGVLSHCFHDILRGEPVAPNRQRSDRHKCAIALRLLGILLGPFAAKMGLMRLHIAGFRH